MELEVAARGDRGVDYDAARALLGRAALESLIAPVRTPTAPEANSLP